MPRVKIGPALPDRAKLDVEIARLRDLDVVELRADGMPCSAATACSPSSPSPVSQPGVPVPGRSSRRLGLGEPRLLDRSGSPEKAGQRALDLRRHTAALRPGTILGREWNGQMQQVAVLADGFAYNGKTYSSLSKMAFAITGTRWNGPKFFGLRDKPIERVLAMKARSTKNGSLRDLYPGLDRPGAGAGFQFARCPV